MTLEDYAKQAAEELAKEIDAQVLRDILKESGWHEVVLEPMVWERSDNIDLWVQENIKGGMWTYGLVWMFKDQKDANWFSLRWQ